MALTTPDISDTQPTKRPNRKVSLWRVLGLILCGMVLLVLIACAYVWSHRYDLAQNIIRDILAEQGLEAELDIKSASRTRAVVGDITLRADGQTVFSADEIVTEYQWRDLLDGNVERIVLTKPRLRLTLDDSGAIIDSWIPAGGSGGGETPLPPRGITLNDAQITAITPYGEIPLRGDIDVKTRETITADLTLSETTLTYQDISASVAGPLAVTIDGPDITLSTNLRLPLLSLDDGRRSLSDMTIVGDHIITRGEATVIKSDMELRTSAVNTQRFDGGRANLRWAGTVELSGSPTTFARADGLWDVSITQAQMRDPALARDLAATLSLRETLSVTPIAESFAGGLSAMAEDLLRGVDITGAGELSIAPDQISLRLSEGLRIESPKTQLTVQPAAAAALYEFDRTSQSVNTALSLALDGRYPMRLSALQLNIESPDGIAVDRVRSISARLDRPRDWTTTRDGRNVRLGAGAMALRYKDGTKRQLNMSGPIDFDGPLPGGYVTGLQSEGQLAVSLVGETISAKFSPKNNAPVRLARIETPATWRADDIAFTLDDGDAPLFVKTANETRSAAALSALTASAVEVETGRKMALSLAHLTANGVLTDAAQDWTITADEARVTTDDFIGKGVVMSSPSAQLKATLTPNADPQLQLSTESANVTTPLLSARKIPLTLSGTPTAFTIDYGGKDAAGKRRGLISLVGDDVPPLPLTGQLRLEDGVYRGTATTVLPKGETSPINVDYTLKDGAGTADVSIPALRFAKGKLQPQDLVSALRGKIADVNGTVSANFKLAFAPGQPLQSSGRATLNNLDFGTLPGPFTGVSTALEFSSIFPLETSGEQILTLDSFNPGIALNDGVIKYELVDGGVRIIDARWPLVNGNIAIDPTLWAFGAEENRVTLRVNEVSVGAFLGEIGGGNLTATGDVTGTIPVIVRGVSVLIDGGYVAVEDGGVIQYRSAPLVSPVDLIPEEFVTLQDLQQIQAVRKNPTQDNNIGKDLAFTALRNFEYETLSAKLNGPIDGEIELGIRFLGSNPKILAGTQFDFTVTIIGELVNMALSLKPDSSLERLRGYIDMGNIVQSQEPADVKP